MLKSASAAAILDGGKGQYKSFTSKDYVDLYTYKGQASDHRKGTKDEMIEKIVKSQEGNTPYQFLASEKLISMLTFLHHEPEIYNITSASAVEK